MKIEKVKNEDVRKFDELTVGDAFRLPNHFSTDLHIKTEEFVCYKYFGDSETQEDNVYNAIKLNNGKPTWFPGYERVVVPNCKIVVE